MRERSTWSKQATSETPRQAATQRQADIYTMNQEHPQPSPVEYENGSPDTWAETPVPADKMSVKEEYEGDHVKRNELGLGEFREDTWKHKDSDNWGGKGKYDNAKVSAERKAEAAERISRAMLRTSNEKLVEDMAIDLMAMPPTILASTLKRLDQVSPDALPKEAKYRRAMSCVKLAARTLGSAATEDQVGALGQLYMSMDDPTLRSMLKVVAAVRVAEQEEQEQEGGHTSQVDKTGQVAPTAQVAPVAQQQEEEEEEAGHTSQQEQAHGIGEEDLACLDELIHEEMAEGAPGAVAPAPAPGGGLESLFTPAPPVPAIPVQAPVPMMASGSEISFDDDDSDEVPSATTASDPGLESLFNDHPEVVAQREIAAAEIEQKAREGGFAPVAGRTASSKGARKLGAVSKSKIGTEDDMLASLWDRPGQ